MPCKATMKTRRKSSARTGTTRCTKCPGCAEGQRHDNDQTQSANVNSRVPRRGKKRTTPSESTPPTQTVSTNSSQKESVTITGNSSLDQGISHSSPINPDGSESSGEIMKIDTKNYCLFCYKPCSNSNKTRSKVNNAEQSTVDPSKREISSKYLKLLTRYLKLDIYSHINNGQQQDVNRHNFFTKTLKPDENRFEITACDACFGILNSFCELYHQLQHVQIQLDWNVVKLRNIMRCAEKVPSRMTEFRKNVLEGRNGMKNEEKMIMDGFKREFFRNSIPKRFPKVVLAKYKEKDVSNVGTPKKHPKTVLVQSLHELSTNDDDISEIPRPKARTIQVLKIGQELKLTSRSKSSDSIAVPEETKAAAQKSSVRAPSPNQEPVILKQASSSIVKPKPSSQGIVEKPTAVKSVPKSPNQVGGSASKTRTIIKIVSRSIPFNVVKRMPLLKSKMQALKRQRQTNRRHISDRKGEKEKMSTTQKTPSISSTTSCEVIDLCESDEEDDASNHSPAKRAKTSDPEPVGVVTSISNQSTGNPEVNEDNEDEARGGLEGTEIPDNDVQNHEGRVTISSGTHPPTIPATLPTEQQVSINSKESASSEIRNLPNVDHHCSSYESLPNHAGDLSTETSTISGENNIQIESRSLMNSVNPFEMSHPPQEMEPEYIPEVNFPIPPLQHPTTGQFTNLDAYVPTETFELPIPSEQPGDEIQVTLDHAAPEDSTVITVTHTHTITSTFHSISTDVPLDDNFPIAPTFPIFDSVPVPVFEPDQRDSHEAHSHPQPSGSFENSFDSNLPNEMNGTFYNAPPPPESYFHSNIPTSEEPQPIVTEVDDNDNIDNFSINADNSSSQNNPANQEIGCVEISEVVGESNECENVETIDDSSDNDSEVFVILQSNVNQTATASGVENLENNNLHNVQA